MNIVRGTALLAVLLAVSMVGAGTAAAQQDSAEREARSRELSERMRVTLTQWARVQSQMQRDLQRAARSDSRVRDSIVRATSQQIAELATEIARVQAEADRIQGRAVDAETRAQLRTQIASARATANVMRALSGQQRALTLINRSMPRGYLGVTFSSEQSTEVRDGAVFTVFMSPAVIETVEPGSPAAKAGLEGRDTIIAFGSISLPGAIALAEVIKPGEHLQVKIRRAGRERSMNVLVGERQVFAGTLDGVGARVCDGDECAMTITSRAPRAARAPRVTGMPGVPAAAAPPVATGPVYLRAPAWSSTDYSVAGAVMTTITDELEDLTGVDQGILVLRVAPGTPAASSGLRGGDVIVRINDEDCEGVRDLQQAVQRAGSRGGRQVALVVRRQKKEQQVTLRW